MHNHSNLNLNQKPGQTPGQHVKGSKITFISTLEIFSLALFVLFVLWGAGALAWEKDLGTPPQKNQPHRTVLFPFIPEPREKPVKIEDEIKKGDTIISILVNQGIDPLSAHRFFTGIKPVYNLKEIGVGKKYTLYLSKKEKEILGFKYEIDSDYYLEVKLDSLNNSYIAKLHRVPYVVKKEFISGEIRESLFQSILDAGEKPELADMMASLYEYDIDFNRDLRKEDSFALLVEKMYLNGRFVRYGHVLATRFTNKGITTGVVRYTDPEGKTAYYHPDGRSVRKMFLRCPLPFMHVTSRYGGRRHPLWNYSANHRGVDLAAPVGTRIRSTAAGVVLQMGTDASRGRFLSIRHQNQYVSHYYHLSGYFKGIQAGQRVEQGQIIGYVGDTGWSTGPHLHYGLQKNGRFLNPLGLSSPTLEPVKEIYKDDLRQYAAVVSFLLSGSQIVKIPRAISETLLESPLFPGPKPEATSI